MKFLGLTLGIVKVNKASVNDIHDMSTVGGRLSYLISAKKTTQTAVAREIGITPQTIQHLCKSKSSKSRYLTEISMALDVNPIWLTTGKGSMLASASNTNEVSIPLLNFDDVINFVESGRKNYNSSVNISLSAEESCNFSFAIIVKENDSFRVMFPVNTLLIFEIKGIYKEAGHYLIESEELSIQKLNYKDNVFYYESNHNLLTVDQNNIIAQLIESRVSYQQLD